MRDDARAPATSATGAPATTTAVEPSEPLAQRFGEAFVDGDACFSLDRDGEPIATVRVNFRAATIRSVPAPGQADDPVGRAHYAAAVLGYAVGQVRHRAALLDVSDPQPERLLDPLADQLPTWPTRAQPLVRGPFSLGDLRGTIAHAGASEGYKPGRYQVRLPGAGTDEVMLSFTRAASPFEERAVRVAPAATALLIGLDETSSELAGYLRALGLAVVAAEVGTVRRRDRWDELQDRGLAVLDSSDVAGLTAALGEYPPVRLIVEGDSADSERDPEGHPVGATSAGEATNRAAVLTLRERFGCPVLFKDAVPGARWFDAAAYRALGIVPDPTADWYFPHPVDATLVQALLPLLAGDQDGAAGLATRAGSVEVTGDLLLPTTTPYGPRNRHSPDDVAVKVARGAERRLLTALDALAPRLKEGLRPTRDPALLAHRPRALALHQRLGPWTVHAVVDLEIRAQGPDGEPIRAAAYKACLAGAGDLRLVDFDEPGQDQEELLALDGTALQNLAFQKLGAIHHFRPTAVVLPLSDTAFKVVVLVPQDSGGYLNRLEAALVASGVSGAPGPLVRQLVAEAVELPRIDARLADTFPARGVTQAAPGPRIRRPPALAGPVSDQRPEPPVAVQPACLRVAASTDGHALATAPAPGLDWHDPAQRAVYVATLLDYLHDYAVSRGIAVVVDDAHPRDLRRLLAEGSFHPDPTAAGRARAPFALGPFAGTRWRLGSDRVPVADRLLQVDLYRRDDPADEPRSLTITVAGGDDAPLLALPTTVQLVCGFGNIAGDLGVLERRLGYRVVAWNRSPNERARHALENGIPLYEFDETIDRDGQRVVQTRQRDAYARAGLPLAGTVRDLLDQGLVIGTTTRGRAVRARVGHILDGLFGSARHPATGKSTKNSEIYRDLLFREYEARGIPTIYNGYNTPEKVAGGRIFVHDAFRTSQVDPGTHYGELDGSRHSIMCVSCNTTNITSVLLRLIAIPGLSDVTVRVLTNRKTCDPFVGEGKQSVNYQGMAFDLNYHHWEDARLFFDGVRDPTTRDRLGRLFAREVKAPGEDPEWAISTHATGQAGTEFHVGLVHVSGRLNGGPLDAGAIKAAIAGSGIENVQVIDFPGDRINSTQFLATLHQRIGIRNLYVQPCMVVQDGADVLIVFFTPHLYNVKPNNLVAALNRDGLVPNTVVGLDAATAIVASALGLSRQRAALRRYYPPRLPAAAPGALADPVYFFGPGVAEGMAIPDAEERRQLLGGKGAGLTELAVLRYDDPTTGQSTPIPVPPGYTLTTAEARRYFENGRRLTADQIAAIDAAQARLETLAGKRFGDPSNPLLVSVRSGAAVSMPGMMDTVLNLGLNDQVVEGLAAATGDRAFAWDTYLRFVEMFAEVVLGVDRTAVLHPLRATIEELAETPLTGGAARELVRRYKEAVAQVTGYRFPEEPRAQLLAAITAVFNSSYSERAVTYRQIHGISPTVISAVSVVAMVFGNLGEDSATGVVFTRDPLTGEHAINGEYLTRAQGEDVVRGVRTGQPLATLAGAPAPALRDAHRQLVAVASALERHFRDALDLEFTVERGKLWLLQTRRLGGRSGRAALRIVTNLVDEGLITPSEAVLQFGDPRGLNELLAPIFDPRAEAVAQAAGRLLTRGIAASAGAACGVVAVSSARAEALSQRGERVILVRPETAPEDVGGLHSAQGVLTARGGIVSHAAIVARGIGKAAVVGASEVAVDEVAGCVRFGDRLVTEGEVISVNGTTGTVYLGELPVVPSPIKQKVAGRPIDAEGEDLYQRFLRLLAWAGATKAMEIRANAETPRDLAVALTLGAEGIGLARTEHAVLEPAERRIAFSALILAANADETARALAVLEPPMEEEVYQIFRLLAGKPATIRLYDPVPNEFLPRSPEEVGRIAQFLEIPPDELRARAAARAETNPMLGHRGVRLFVVEPAIAAMQVRATLRAAARAMREGFAVRPEIQIPLVINRTEIALVADTIRQAAAETCAALGVEVPYAIGVMVETPAAVRTADEFAPDIQFFSLGVNDLSQTVLAVSRDDTARFIGQYENLGILGGDPFRSIDRIVGSFVAESVERAKRTNPKIFIFSAGDVGGDPPSVNLFHDLGLDGVSAGPWLVPLGILSAAQANLRRPRAK